MTTIAELIDVRPLVPYEANARTHSAAQIDQLKEAYRQFGFVGVIAYARPDALKIGHGRRQAAIEMWEDGETIMGPGKREALPAWHLPAIDVSGLNDAEMRALVIADNKLALNADWDETLLRAELAALDEMDFELPSIGFDPQELEALFNPPTPAGGPSGAGSMAAEFLIPPFSVLNAREGWWQERKRRWIGLGIKSELGRGENSLRSAPQPMRERSIIDGLTQVSAFDGWWAKREDDAGYIGDDFPTGAKVRQFLSMAANCPGAPMLVGCSAESAMQIYVAALSKYLGVHGIVYVAGRKTPSAATQYARAMGAEVNEVRPGHLSVCRARARERSKEIGQIVKWNPKGATEDTAAQCANIPAEAKRVVVPLGTGAIAAGILVGLARAGRVEVTVVCVAVSDMADPEKIIENAGKMTDLPLPPLLIERASSDYDKPEFAALPDGTPLDPFYAAKALPFVQDGDCLWISGCRPLSAFPPMLPGRINLNPGHTGLMPNDRKGRKADAIPGGAGPNAAYRNVGIHKGGKGKAHVFAQENPESRLEAGNVVAGNGWGNGGPARRDAQFYAKKRAWEKENGREISTTEFREKHWDGAVDQTSIPAGLNFGEIANFDGAERTITGTSIFDPVLCELVYRWFSPPGGTVLDPFAGGSVRGVVAAALERQYVGVDLREEQVEANGAQWPAIAAALGDQPDGRTRPKPDWRIGDSAVVLPQLDVEADLIFSCPPYGDLEIYSDDPADISTLDVAAFDAAYKSIIAAALTKLRPDRFAVFVVGDYRDKRGLYRNFVSKTIEAFQSAGASLYNRAILVTAVGSLPIRAAKQFRTTRKLGNTHQDVVIFVKGDPRKATAALGPVDVSAALELIEPDAED